MRRGIEYFAECAREPGVFRQFGGDILFLSHKLAVVVDGQPGSA